MLQSVVRTHTYICVTTFLQMFTPPQKWKGCEIGIVCFLKTIQVVPSFLTQLSSAWPEFYPEMTVQPLHSKAIGNVSTYQRLEFELKCVAKIGWDWLLLIKKKNMVIMGKEQTNITKKICEI